MKKTVLFDLDGTLVDTSEGILKSIRSTIQDLSLEMKSSEELKRFIGPPLQGAFEEIYGLSSEKAKEAVVIFRKYYSEGDQLLCQPYEGIQELLSNLRDNGQKVYVATSKPTKYAIEILKSLHMNEYFAEIVGSNLDNTRSKKAEVIQYILDKLESTSSVIMVGDKAQDLIGANKTGIDAIGVTYGFGTRAELEEEQHLAIVDTMVELERLLLEDDE